MIKILCDRCEKDISASQKIGYIALNFKEGSSGDFLQDNPMEHKHYCIDCMDKIQKFITSRQILAKEEPADGSAEKPMEAEAEHTEMEQTAKKRRPIDYGKIMALKNAGWDNAKIADEMQMTRASVATAISTYRKKRLDASETAGGGGKT